MNIIFCGTPACTLPSLNLLNTREDITISLIVSMPDRPAGRGKKLVKPPVAQFAHDNKLPVIQTENLNRDPKFLEFIKDNKIDAIIVFAFAQFFGSKILSRIPCFNVHTSLLPAYRGAAPVQYALLNGETKTGITIQRMVKKMDAGDIALANEVSIDSQDDSFTLLAKLQEQVPVTLDLLLDQLVTNSVTFTAQDESLATFAPSIPKSMGHVNFSAMTYTKLINLKRALSPKPGLFCFLDEKRIKIIDLEPSMVQLEPGKISTKYDMLSVGTKDKTVRLKTIQLEGKKCCDDLSFINGFKHTIPDHFS